MATLPLPNPPATSCEPSYAYCDMHPDAPTWLCREVQWTAGDGGLWHNAAACGIVLRYDKIGVTRKGPRPASKTAAGIVEIHDLLGLNDHCKIKQWLATLSAAQQRDLVAMACANAALLSGLLLEALPGQPGHGPCWSSYKLEQLLCLREMLESVAAAIDTVRMEGVEVLHALLVDFDVNAEHLLLKDRKAAVWNSPLVREQLRVVYQQRKLLAATCLTGPNWWGRLMDEAPF